MRTPWAWGSTSPAQFSTFHHKPDFSALRVVAAWIRHTNPPARTCDLQQNPRAEATVQAHRLLFPAVHTQAPSMPGMEVQCPHCHAWVSASAELVLEALPNNRRLRPALQKFMPSPPPGKLKLRLNPDSDSDSPETSEECGAAGQSSTEADTATRPEAGSAAGSRKRPRE